VRGVLSKSQEDLDHAFQINKHLRQEYEGKL
jgi:hypothetical protein